MLCLFVLKCVFCEKREKFEQNWYFDKIAITETLDAFLSIWDFFYLERYIKIYIIFGKNNIKGVEYKKKYFNSNVWSQCNFFFTIKWMTIRFNKILRSCSSLVLHVSDLIDQFRNSTSLFVIYNEHAQHPHKIQTNQSQLLYRHLPIMQLHFWIGPICIIFNISIIWNDKNIEVNHIFVTTKHNTKKPQ